MKVRGLFDKVKVPGVAAMAAVVAIATVSPGGALPGTGGPDSSQASGRAYASFVSDFVDQAVSQATAQAGSNQDAIQALGTVAEAVKRTVQSQLSTQSASSSQSQSNPVQSAAVGGITLPPLPDLPDLPNLPELPTPGEGETPNVDDVIASLLALLNGAQADVLAALAIAEQAFLAMIDDAKAKATAAFAMGDFGSIETFVIEQLDWARTLVQQAFAMIRAKIIALFTDARNRVVEELTGVDLGEATEEVLAEIQRIRDFVDFLVDRVNDVIGNLVGGLGSLSELGS